MSNAEDRLRARGLTIEEFAGPSLVEAAEHLQDPHILGFLRLSPVDGGAIDVNALLRPNVEAEDREWFASEVEQRIDRYFEHGPEPDGWQQRVSDGGWQLWLRAVQLPDLDQ